MALSDGIERTGATRHFVEGELVTSRISRSSSTAMIADSVFLPRRDGRPSGHVACIGEDAESRRSSGSRDFGAVARGRLAPGALRLRPGAAFGVCASDRSWNRRALPDRLKVCSLDELCSPSRTASPVGTLLIVSRHARDIRAAEGRALCGPRGSESASRRRLAVREIPVSVGTVQS